MFYIIEYRKHATAPVFYYSIDGGLVSELDISCLYTSQTTAQKDAVATKGLTRVLPAKVEITPLEE